MMLLLLMELNEKNLLMLTPKVKKLYDRFLEDVILSDILMNLQIYI
jgi:hypothetical protein